MSSAFISSLPSSDIIPIFTGDSLLSIASAETEHLLRFHLSSCHEPIRVDSLPKWNDLNRRRFQRSRFKTRAQLVGDFRNLSQRQSITVDSEQPGEVVIEVDEIETDVGMSRACEKLVSEKRFRSDLYYRLNVFPIPVPPLRNRAEDIPLLVRHFVSKYAGKMQKRIDEIPVEAMNALRGHSWPGNIRELQNFIERSVILTTGNTLRPRLEGLRQCENGSPEAITLEEAERDHIRKTLKQTKGVVAGPHGAAARLGMRRSTLYFHMQRLGISRSRQNSWAI
jgi:hypothetical protein